MQIVGHIFHSHPSFLEQLARARKGGYQAFEALVKTWDKAQKSRALAAQGSDQSWNRIRQLWLED